MKQINYKSDFDFILRLKDCAGNLIGWPDYDWTAKFWTSQKVNAFAASCRGGVCKNCYNDNGQIHIVANDHKMSAGVLNVEFTAEISNGIYPDDAERIVVPLPLEIELIRAAAPCPESFEVEVMLPYIKGEKGEKGEKGPIGPQGERGSDGKDGLNGVDGKNGASAYEQAVQGGYEGTETEFVEGLANVGKLPDIVTNALRKNKQYLTEEEKEQVKKNLSISKMELFIDMWKSAMTLYTGSNSSSICIGDYDEQTGLFNYDNKLSFTYEEVLTAFVNHNVTLYNNYWFLPLALPMRIGHTASIASLFDGCRNLKICALDSYYSTCTVSSIVRAFASCSGLEYIVGKPLELNFVTDQIKTTDTFSKCYKLKEVFIKNLRTSISFSSSLDLALACFEYMITNAANTTPITITVHPDVYAKLTDTANTEWHKVLTDAAAKNISIATV